MRLKVEPPDVNSSRYMFTVSGERSIRYGLGAIKGVGQSVVDMLVAEREAQDRIATWRICAAAAIANRINRRVLEALIRSGAVDALGANRATLMHALPSAMQLADQTIRARVVGPGRHVRADGHERQRAARRSSTKRCPSGAAACGSTASATRSACTSPVIRSRSSKHEVQPDHQRPHRRCDRRSAGAERTKASSSKASRRPSPAWCSISASAAAASSSRSMIAAGASKRRCSRTCGSSIAPSIAKSAILIVEGLLRFDEYIEGWRLNAKRVIDIDHAREQHARRLVAPLAGAARTAASSSRSSRPCGRSAAAAARSPFATTVLQREQT